MINKIIISIAAVGMFGVIAANGASSLASFLDAEKRVEDIRRGDIAVNELRRLAQQAGNDALMPAGVQTSDGYIVPANFGFAAAGSGAQKYQYCPFGPVDLTEAERADRPEGIVQILSGTVAQREAVAEQNNGQTGPAYLVKIQNGVVVAGRPSHIARVTADPPLMGFIIIPNDDLEPAARCEDVTFDETTGEFFAPLSTVRAIWRSQSESNRRAFASAELTYYVAPSAAATNDGLSAATPMTLVRAMSDIAVRRPESVNIVFAPGNYSTGSATALDLGGGVTDNAFAFGTGIGSRLTFRGSGVVNVTGLTTARNVISYSGDLTIIGINFGSMFDISIPAGRSLNMISSTAGSVRLQNSDANISNSVLSGSSSINAGLLVSGGKANVSSSTIGHGLRNILVEQGGTLSLTGAVALASTAGVTPSFGIAVERGSTLSLVGAQVTSSPLYTTAVANIRGVALHVSGGEVSMVDSSLNIQGAQPDAAVRLDDGAAFSMDNTSSVAARGLPAAATAILDMGAISVSGTGRVIVGASDRRCWAGPAFSSAGLPGSVTSAPNGTVAAASTTSFVKSTTVDLGTSDTAVDSIVAAEAAAQSAKLQQRNQARKAFNRSAWRCALS